VRSDNGPEGACVRDSVSRPCCVAFFSEESVAAPQGEPPPFLRLLRAFPHEARIILNTPVSAAQSRPLEESPKIEFSHRPAYGGSFVGFLVRFPWILLPTWRHILWVVSHADVVVSQFPSPVFPLIAHAVRQQNKPHILYIVGDIRKVVESSGKYPWLARRLVVAPIAEVMHRLALRAGKSSMVIAVSSSLAQLYGSSTVKPVTFAPTAVAAEEIFDRQNTCQSTPTRLLFVGRLVPVKGLEYLLEAVHLLLHDGVPVRLTLVGTGPHQKALIALAAEHSLMSSIEFTGEISYGPSLRALYRKADIFVLPSLSEGAPRVLWEAMAAGLPIVATRVGGVPEIIQDGETGLLVNPRSAQQLAASIQRMIEDEELRMRLIRAGYLLIREHTVERQATMLWEHITAYLERDL